jgi:ferric iron reductase protein FhuF
MTAAALAEAAKAGPYFVITVEPDELLWRPFAELLDPAVLSENVGQVRRVLQERTGADRDDLDLRACASIHALGLVSRLIAPALGSVALAGHVPSFEIAQLRWQRVAGGAIPVALVGAGGVDVTPATASAAIHSHVIEPAVVPLVTAFEKTFTLSSQVLWGNVASAVAGAATMLGRGSELAERVTATGRLAGMGTWSSSGFVRNNCCLFYKIPGGGTCGDCVLNQR